MEADDLIALATKFIKYKRTSKITYIISGDNDFLQLGHEKLYIADYKKDDTYLDEDGREVINQEVIARSRLRVDARKWVASKLKPKKFGDYTKVQAEIKDTSATSSWLGEVLSEIDNNK
jgi:5'-3' exonuclease